MATHQATEAGATGSMLADLLTRATADTDAGRIDDALASYDRALELAPARADLHFNVGALRHARGAHAAAQASFSQATRLAPAWLPAWLALGRACFDSGDYPKAQAAFESAVVLDVSSVEAAVNLGLTLQRLGEAQAAQPHFERARALAPNNTQAWFALRGNLLALGRLDDAVQDFLRFRQGAPASAELVVTGLMFARMTGDAGDETRYLEAAIDWPYRPDQVELAAVTVARLQYHDVAPATIARMYRTYDRLQQARTTRPLADADAQSPKRSQARLQAAGARLRVGYLSADFRAHVMGRLLDGVLTAHDRARVSLHLFSLSPPAAEDALTARMRVGSDSFDVLHGEDDLAAARTIAARDVDILVDLMGHSAGSRPGILRAKPAPVIATHLGYHGCIGVSQVDFKITDRFADPPDAGQHQIEAPLLIDACVLPVCRIAPAVGNAASRRTLGIEPDQVAFGVFVGLYKLSARCLALWRRVLERVPATLLLFSPLNAAEEPIYRRHLDAHGIPRERVRFLPPPADDAHARARYRLVDAVLDTMPYSGGDATAAALDMGVPVITVMGARHAERVTSSLLAHLGLFDTIANKDADYIDLACRIAEDAAWRRSVAARIVERLPASGLADPRAHARALENAYLRALEAKAQR
jgi:predicted O-linked N-acetylglucosamine transferase (SPINDLY family)